MSRSKYLYFVLQLGKCNSSFIFCLMTFIFRTMITYGVWITVNVSNLRYDFGVKNQGQIYINLTNYKGS